MHHASYIHVRIRHPHPAKALPSIALLGSHRNPTLAMGAPFVSLLCSPPAKQMQTYCVWFFDVYAASSHCCTLAAAHGQRAVFMRCTVRLSAACMHACTLPCMLLLVGNAVRASVHAFVEKARVSADAAGPAAEISLVCACACGHLHTWALVRIGEGHMPLQHIDCSLHSCV
jgi:hypothetical protein